MFVVNTSLLFSYLLLLLNPIHEVYEVSVRGKEINAFAVVCNLYIAIVLYEIISYNL